MPMKGVVFLFHSALEALSYCFYGTVCKTITIAFSNGVSYIACFHKVKHLRFLNGAVLRNLNMYSSQKLYPVCTATWLRDALKPKKFRKNSLTPGTLIKVKGITQPCSTAYWVQFLERIHIKSPQNTTIQKP